MSLDLENKKTSINSLTTSISAVNSSTCSSFPWSTIQDKLDNIDTKAATIESTALSVLDDDLADTIDSTKNYGMPCGVSSSIGNPDIDVIFNSKWNIFDKLAGGNLYDSSITLLQTTGLSCADLNTYLGTVLANFDLDISNLATLNSKLSSFSGINDEIMSLIGVVGTFLGCSADMFNAVNAGSSWLSEVNSNYSKGLESVNTAKSLGGTPGDIYNNSISNINSSLNWDSQLSTLKSDFSDLTDLF